MRQPLPSGRPARWCHPAVNRTVAAPGPVTHKAIGRPKELPGTRLAVAAKVPGAAAAAPSQRARHAAHISVCETT